MIVKIHTQKILALSNCCVYRDRHGRQIPLRAGKSLYDLTYYLHHLGIEAMFIDTMMEAEPEDAPIRITLGSPFLIRYEFNSEQVDRVEPNVTDPLEGIFFIPPDRVLLETMNRWAVEFYR